MNRFVQMICMAMIMVQHLGSGEVKHKSWQASLTSMTDRVCESEAREEAFPLGAQDREAFNRNRRGDS